MCGEEAVGRGACGRLLWLTSCLFLCVQPAAIPVGLIKTCIHTYAALAFGVVVYNMDKAGACASVCMCVCVSAFVYMYVHVRARVSLCASARLPVRPSVCLPVCLSVCLSVSLSVCL